MPAARVLPLRRPCRGPVPVRRPSSVADGRGARSAGRAGRSGAGAAVEAARRLGPGHTYRMRTASSWVVLALALGCGGAGAPGASSAESGAATSTGAEAAAPAPGPVRSFVPETARVVARIDMARVRRSPVGPDIAGAIRASESFQDWAGGSGLDPVADLDAILMAGDALYTNRRVIVLRTTGDEARARDLLLRIGVAHGTTAAWRQIRGYPVAAYPDPSLPVPHVVVLTALHEIVLAPEDDLERVLDVADDHARRRAGEADLVEPALAFREGEIVVLTSGEPMPSRPGYPTPPQRYRLEVVEQAGDRTAIHMHGSFNDETEAATAHAWLETQARTFSEHMLVRMAQLDRPLTEARIGHDGTELDASTDFTIDELRRALGAVALFQASSDPAI